MRRRWIVIGVVVLLVVAVVVIVLVRVRDDRSRFAAAVALAPESTDRFSWTDWAAVRDELDAGLSASSSTEDLEDFLLEAFDRDLTAGTALEASTPTIHAEMGFSPATIDWELFAQGKRGAVVIMGVAESFDVERVRDALRTVGFTEPDEEDGVWLGGVDLLEELGGPVTPELAAVQVDEDAGLILGSDNPDFLASRADTERGDRDDGVAQVVDATGEALTANAYTGDHACSALAMSEADPTDRTRAAELVEEAGEVHPLTGFAIAGQPGGDVRVAMAFDEEDQAQADARTRSRLASGPAPGQGGDFRERFTLGRVAADGRVLTMELERVEGAFVLSDLNNGPVLFATC